MQAEACRVARAFDDADAVVAADPGFGTDELTRVVVRMALVFERLVFHTSPSSPPPDTVQPGDGAEGRFSRPFHPTVRNICPTARAAQRHPLMRVYDAQLHATAPESV